MRTTSCRKAGQIDSTPEKTPPRGRKKGRRKTHVDLRDNGKRVEVRVHSLPIGRKPLTTQSKKGGEAQQGLSRGARR